MPSETFTYTGSEQTWTVPDGVELVEIECWGAEGGTSNNGGANPGQGGYAYDEISVTPGETLYITVGRQGGTTGGGWPDGGRGDSGSFSSDQSGGGGGSSDVRQGGNARADRIVVGGGGGGAGEWSSSGGHGGGGGGSSGGGGTNGNDGSNDGEGGGGGDQSSGGDDGWDFDGSRNAGSGSFGSGGGGSGADGAPGGGGGGGWYGGGGGGAGDTSNDGGGGGGGGSGFVSTASGTFNSSTNSGNGQVTIAYEGTISDLTATANSGDQIDLGWSTTFEDHDGFYVYRADSSGSPRDKTQIADVTDPGQTSYSDTGLTDGKSYFYQVTAYFSDGSESDPTNEASDTTDLPAASNVTLDTSVEDEITVDWIRNDDSPDGTWELYRSTDGSLGSVVATFTDLSTTSYQDTGLADGEEYHYTVRRSTADATADSSQVAGTTILPAPADLALTVASKGQIDASWTDDSDNEDAFEIQTRPSGGSSWTGHGTLAPGTTTGSATGLRNGEQYDVRIRVSTEHVTEYSTVAQATTDHAAITSLIGDASVEDEITLHWDDTANYGEYRVEYRESTASTWTDAGTVSEAVTSTTIGGLVDGRQYDFRVRHETEHGSGDWTTIAEATLLPGPTNFSVGNPSLFAFDAGTDLDLSWTDNSDNPEEVWRVFAREHGESFVDDSGALPANTESYTFSPGVHETAFDLKVRIETDYVYADSEVLTASTPIEPGDAYWLALQTSEHDYVSVKEIDSVEAPLEHTVKNGWSVTVPYSPGVEDRMGDESWFFWKESLLVRGEFLNPTSRESAGETTLSGEDTAKRLDRGGAIEQYQAIEGWKAIQDYWGQYTDFEPVTVQEPSPTVIDEGKTVQEASSQSELEALFADSITDTTPAAVTSGGIESLQACFTVEAQNYDRGTATAPIESGFTSKQVVVWGEIGNSGDYAEYDFTPAYDIPAEHFAIQVRAQNAGGTSPPNVDVYLDGNHLGFVNFSTGSTSVIDWFTAGPNSAGVDEPQSDLSGGETHTLRFEQATDEADNWYWGTIAPYDERYSFNFSNSLDSNDALPGPQWYPDAVPLETSQHDDTFNVRAASLVVAMDDTSNGQALAVSNTDGSSYDLQGPNSGSVSGELGTVGSLVRGRVTLSRHGTGTSTPTTGRQGQTLSEWTLEVDTDDLAVLDQIELIGSHFSNLQKLHDRAGMRWVMDYQTDALPVESFERGGIVKQADWVTEDVERDPDYSEYANVQTVYGAVDEDSGERLVATARSETAIAADGEELPAPPEFKPELDTRGDLKSVARNRLSERLAAGALEGSVDIAPKAIRPGYSYEVPDLDGETLALERVTFSEGIDGARGSLAFGDLEDLASRLAGISSGVKSVKEAF